MDKITYFGTNGCSGHSPIGINYQMNTEEYEQFCGVDSKWLFDDIAENYNKEHKCSYWSNEHYTSYCINYSVDDYRSGSHTDLFVEGKHSIEYMESIILRNSFLRKQFDIQNRFK